MGNSLRTKLIIFTFGSILLTLFVAGLSIDILLANLYGDKAKVEAFHAYEMLYEKIEDVENNIVKVNRSIASNPDIIAPANLVNRYQDINNYEPLIFDQEKKSLANHLLEHMYNFDLAKSAVYDKRGNLIAFSEVHGQKKSAGFTTYKDNKEIYLVKSLKDNSWNPLTLPEYIDKKLNIESISDSFISHFGYIEYHSNKDDFTITGTKSIVRQHMDGTNEIVGYIKIIRMFDHHYIEEIEEKSPVKISAILANNKILNRPVNFIFPVELERKSHLFGSQFSAEKEWLNNDVYYTQAFVIPVVNGKIYFLLSQPRSELQAALNKSRYLLLLIFIVIAILVIPYGIYWLNKRVSGPLNKLTRQLSEVDKNHYPEFYLPKVRDEIYQLGNGLNNMVNVIKSREESLKSSQVDLKEAQHLSKIGSWKLNLDTHALNWSDGMYDIFEMDAKQVTPSFEKFLEIVFAEDRKIVDLHYKDLINNKQPFNLKFRIEMKDDVVKYIDAHSEINIDKNGAGTIARGTIQDVTRQKQNDELLSRTQKMDALGKLTGGIAHDFNNMLGIVLGYSELLQDILEGDKKKQTYISHVIEASKRASALTSKLLSFSRKEAATIEDVDINESLLDDRNLLEKTLTSRIELIYDLEEGLWTVSLDKSDLQNAVLNMVINAMHAMKSSGKITIKTLNVQLDENDVKSMDLKPGDYVQLSITDTGMGMSEEVRSKLFDPFFSTKGDEGTGLGMSQVYGFAQQTGGGIYVFSEPGHGTRIVITLPRSQGSAKLKQGNEQAIDFDKESGDETILVVDDEVELQSSAAEILQRHNYKVLLASNGVEALNVLENEKVDLVLTDVIMPEMDGYKLAHEIMQRYPEIKIQVVSGYSDDNTLEIVDKKLQQQHLQKPYTFKELLVKVRSLLDEDKDNEQELNLKTPIEWSDKFSSGISVIDHDHKILVDLINRCDGTLSEKQAEKNVSLILNDLVDYVDFHFKREELVMDVCNFHESEQHKRLHNILVGNVSEYVKQYGNGNLALDALCKALKKWLVNHIISHDLPMLEYCKDKQEEIERAFKDAGYEN